MHLIDPPKLATLRMLHMLIQQHRLTLESLEASFRAELDLPEGDWSLDLERGLLTPQESRSADAMEQQAD